MVADPFLACFMCNHRASFPELRPTRLVGTILMSWRGAQALGRLVWRCADREACNARGADLVLGMAQAAELVRDAAAT